MDRNQEVEDVVLKVHVSLETLGGERIMEVKTEQIFPDMFGEFVLHNAEATLLTTLNTQVISPARGMVRAYIQKLRERDAYRRTDSTPSSAAIWPNDSEVVAALNARIDTLVGADVCHGHAAAR